MPNHLPPFHSSQSAIGIFDSGVGGLTVMQEIMSLLPHESIVYFGDTARVPYGGKSKETILRYCVENALLFMQKRIKLLVIACNTACSVEAAERLQALFYVPVVGVIEPGVEKACATTLNQKIAILGTHTTIQSGAYQKSLLNKLPNASLYPIACPLLVPLVEEQLFNHPATKLLIADYLSSIAEQKIDTMILGCTHYPLLKKQLQEAAGNNVALVDPAHSCAQKIESLLSQHGLKRQEKESPHYSFYVTDGPEKFKSLGSAILNYPLENVSLAPASGLL